MVRLLPTLLATVVLVCALDSPAVADAQGDARALLKQAFQLRTVGKHREALALIGKAHAVAPSPRTLVQLGLAHQALGHWLEAEKAIKEALAHVSDPHIARHREALVGALKVIGANLGSIELVGGQPGSAVYINRTAAGTLPLRSPVRVLATQTLIEVKAPGYLTFSRIIQVLPGALVREPVHQVPLPSSASGRAANPGSPGQVADQPSQPNERPRRIAAWTLAGASAAFVGMGIAGFVVREQRASDLNSRCLGPDDPTGSCAELASSERTARSVGIAGFAVAGALGASALAVALWPRKKHEPTGRGVAGAGLQVTCDATSGPVGIRCIGRW